MKRIKKVKVKKQVYMYVSTKKSKQVGVPIQNKKLNGKTNKAEYQI